MGCKTPKGTQKLGEGGRAVRPSSQKLVTSRSEAEIEGHYFPLIQGPRFPQAALYCVSQEAPS